LGCGYDVLPEDLFATATAITAAATTATTSSRSELLCSSNIQAIGLVRTGLGALDRSRLAAKR
jgi:hypothetical protein